MVAISTARGPPPSAHLWDMDRRASVRRGSTLKLILGEPRHTVAGRRSVKLKRQFATIIFLGDGRLYGRRPSVRKEGKRTRFQSLKDRGNPTPCLKSSRAHAVDAALVVSSLPASLRATDSSCLGRD